MEAKKYDQFADTLPDDVVDSYDKNKKQKNISLGSFYEWTICDGCLRGLKKYICKCKSDIKL